MLQTMKNNTLSRAADGSPDGGIGPHRRPDVNVTARGHQKPVAMTSASLPGHDLVKDFTLNVAATNRTVDSTSLSKPLNIWPRAELSSPACRKRITATTTAS